MAPRRVSCDAKDAFRGASKAGIDRGGGGERKDDQVYDDSDRSSIPTETKPSTLCSVLGARGAAEVVLPLYYAHSHLMRHSQPPSLMYSKRQLPELQKASPSGSAQRNPTVESSGSSSG